MKTLPGARSRAFTPLSAAAYVTWAAVGRAVWSEAEYWHGVGVLPAQPVAGGLLALFLATVVGLGSIPRTARWRPWIAATLGLQIAATFALLAMGPPSTAPVLLIIVATQLVLLYPARVAWAILLGINVVFLLLLAEGWHAANPGFAVSLYGGFQAFAALTAGAMKRAEKAAETLRITNAELLATRSLLAESARDGERLRVSRELHDVAGHKLTALSLNLELLSVDARFAKRRELHRARDLSAELLSDVRNVVSSLRRDDGMDLHDALTRLTEVFPRPRVTLEVDRRIRVGAERAQVVIRCAQEALTNAARHAAADQVWLYLTQEAGFTVLMVEDDGAYPGHHEFGNGLAGMRERLAQCGGTLDVGPGARSGLRVTARIPQPLPA